MHSNQLGTPRQSEVHTHIESTRLQVRPVWFKKRHAALRRSRDRVDCGPLGRIGTAEGSEWGMQMAMTDETLDAGKAPEIGLVTEVVADTALQGRGARRPSVF